MRIRTDGGEHRASDDGEKSVSEEHRASDDGEKSESGDDQESGVPHAVLEEVIRLSHRERAAATEAEADRYAGQRDERLAEYGLRGRIRPDDDGAVLVVYPADWLEDGVVQLDRIEDTGEALEVPLEGSADPADWADVDEANRDLVAAVEARYDESHAANARALATFASNHYAKPVASLTADELAEFRREYFPRNAWPTDAQRAVIDESIALVFETADEPLPSCQ